MKIKNVTLLLTSLVMTVILIGCSVNEVINVGTPYFYKGTNGVELEYGITNTKEISKLRKIINNPEKMENVNSIENVADVFFSLDRPKDGISEIRMYVWYQSDGTAILSNDMSDYYTLNIEQTNELKRILENK